MRCCRPRRSRSSKLDLLGHFETTCLKAPAAAAPALGARPFGAGALLAGADVSARMELARRYDIPVYSHIYEFARHGAAGAAHAARTRRLADQAAREAKACSTRGSISRTASGSARARSICWRRHGTGVVLNPQGNLKMKCGIPPIRCLAGCGRAHRAWLRQLQLLGRAEHVHGDEAVRAARRSQRSDPRAAAGRRALQRRDRRRAPTARGFGRRSDGSHRACKADSDAHRHERSGLVADEQRGAPAWCTSRPAAA